MQFLNTRETFGFIHKSFHWIMAVLILMLLTMGFVMDDLPPSPDKIWVVMLHKSLGVLVLFLAFARLGWRLANKRPEPEPTLKAWEISLSKIVHFGLYAAFFAMPLTGWIMSSASEYKVSFFGLFDLPRIAPKDPVITGLARDAHNIIALLVIALLALHFGGAAKHHVIDHDRTLQHMTFERMGLKSGIVLLAILGLLYMVPASMGAISLKKDLSPRPEEAAGQMAAVPAPETPAPAAQAATWIMDAGASHIKFTATQSGAPFTGEFKNFTANITFDPETMTGNHVTVEIPIVDMTTSDAQRDGAAKGAEWFDASAFPKAVYAAQSFEKTGANQYIAHGTLTIRDVSKPLDLPFTLDIVKGPPDIAEMKAEVALNRLDFGIGRGEWAATDQIASDVKISIYVKANAALWL